MEKQENKMGNRDDSLQKSRKNVNSRSITNNNANINQKVAFKINSMQ